MAGSAKWDLLAQSEILLNVHRDELGYFEWARVVEAIANGAVLLTEQSSGFGPLEPGEHFAIADRSALPAALATLAEDHEGRAKMRERAYHYLREELPLLRTVQPLLEAIERAGAAPVRRTPRMAPMPKPVPVPASGWARATRAPGDTDYLRMALKHLMLQVQTLERRLEGSVNAAHDRAAITDNAAYHGIEPRVSVVLTLYNYAAVVRDAVRSVALSTYHPLELIVVDDASTDHSLEAVCGAIDEHPWLAARLIRRHANRGLAAARNLGFRCARGELVFVLDADNVVEPDGIEELVTALDDDPSAAFAYGILEQFGREAGLLSWQGWDPEELRLANFIDAMALVRRDVVQELGGYTDDRRLFGLEDFDLWCRIVQRGAHGAFVPRPVGRYRTSGASMISLANIDDRAAWVALAARSPWLAER